MEEERAEPMVVEIYTVDPTLTMEQRMSWPDSDRCLPGLGPSVIPPTLLCRLTRLFT
jgi:hypothetical protein